MRTAIVIPVRLASSRLPGKLLKKVDGDRTVLDCTIEAAIASRHADRVFVAVASQDHSGMDFTQHDRNLWIYLTGGDHKCGTTRVAEVAANTDFDLYVNLQADECEITTKLLDQFIVFMQRRKYEQVGTIASRWQTDSTSVSVAVNREHHALYFSRERLRGGLHHVGVYGYRAGTLETISRLPDEPLADAEDLEQLRWLSRFQTRVMVASQDLVSVNDEASLDMVRKRFARAEAQQKELDE